MNISKIFIIFFLVSFSFQINAQSKTEILENYEKKATEYEVEEKCSEALNYNYLIIKNDSLNFGKNASKRIELLLPKCREKIYKELKGKWKLEKKIDLDYYSNIKFTKFIEFENNKILFYDKSNMIISEIDLDKQPFSMNDFASFPSLKLEKEVWSFSVRKVGSQTRLRLIRNIDKNGNLIGRLDDRGIIIDKRKREKAVKQEVNTYYVKK